VGSGGEREMCGGGRCGGECVRGEVGGGGGSGVDSGYERVIPVAKG
jgi:hypothetical protein